MLLLLPSENNKLILTWKGPFAITEKRSDSDFLIDLGTRKSTFHINLLKKYEERDSGDSSSPAEHRAAAAFSSRENMEKNDPPCIVLKRKETYQDVKIGTELPVEQSAEAEEALRTFQDIFSDVPG